MYLLPKQLPFAAAIRNTFNVDEKCEDHEYECRGTPTVFEASFAGKLPWVLSFNIAEFSSNSVEELTSLPYGISLYGAKYYLAGYSLHMPGHFISVVYWRGRPFMYDGMGTTNFERLKSCANEDEVATFLIKRKDFIVGSYAYYLPICD